MPESAVQVHARILRAHPEGRLPMPPTGDGDICRRGGLAGWRVTARA